MKKLIYYKAFNEHNRKPLGSGQDHIAYATKIIPNAVIKLKKPKGYDSLSFEIYEGDYKRCPHLIAKIIKITKNYLIIEKLDNERVKDEVEYMENIIRQHTEIADMFHYPKTTTSHKYTFDNYDFIYNIEHTLPYAHEVKEQPGNKELFNDTNNILESLKTLDNKCYLMFKGYVDFIWECKRNYISRDIDSNNIGYDIEGNLKCLDV